MYYGTPPITTNGLVYHFDTLNTLSYISGSTNWFSVGNPNISASLFTSSFANNVLVFDGTGSYGNINNITLSGSFTVNIIFNSAATPSTLFTSNEPLLGTNSSSFESRNIGLTSTASVTLTNMGVYIQEDYPIPTLQSNRYYCLTIVRNNDNTINTYLNGTRSDLGISTTEIPSIFTLDTLANSLQTSFFAGALPVFSVYNRALVESEIRQYIQALTPRYNFDTTVTNKSLTASVLDILKTRSEIESSTFESQMYSSSLADLNRVDSLGLLTSASVVITPATYKEGFIYNIKPKKSTYNLLKYTQDFTTAGWSFIRMSASYNYPDPIGGNTATLITVTGSGTVRMNQNVTLLPNNNYNVSWYVSQSNARYANIIFQDSGESLMSATQVDFLSQSFYIRNGGAALSFNPRNLTLENLNNGWYRASFIVTPTASITNNLYKTQIIPNTSSIGAYTSDISASVYIWGGQVTKGTEVQPYQRIISASTSDINYVRTSTNTVIDSNGFVSSSPYNLVTTTTSGLTISGGTVTRNTVIAPDGTLSADNFTKTGNMQIRMDVYLDSISPHSGSQFTLSFWTKLTDTGSTFLMQSEIFPYSGSTPGTQVYPGSYNITNQWQKIEKVFTLNEPLVTYLSVRIGRDTSTTGPSIGRSFSFWGVQITKGTGSLGTQNNFSRLNFPAIDYSAGSPAIRAAVYSENMFVWSNDLTNTNWLKNNLLVASSSILSPSNERNVFTLTATGSNATIKQTRNTFSNRACLFTLYMKRRTGTSPIVMSVGPFTASYLPTEEWQKYQVSGFRISGSYTASAGTYQVTSSYEHGLLVGEYVGFGTSTNFPSINALVTSVPSPTTLTFTSGTTTASGTCNITPHVGSLTITQQGDEIDVWGPQMLGTGYTTISDFRTTSSLDYTKDYIPTSTAAVQRNTETFTVLDITRNAATNSTSGSIYIELAFPYSINGFYTTANFLDFYNVSGSHVFRLSGAGNSFNNPTNYLRWQYIPMASTFTGSPPSTAVRVFRKYLITFNTGRLQYFYEGAKIGSTVNLTTPVDLSIDKIQTAGGQYMLLKNLMYLPYELTNEQAIALTTP